MLNAKLGTNDSSLLVDNQKQLSDKSWISFLYHPLQTAFLANRYHRELVHFHRTIKVEMDKLIAWCLPQTNVLARNHTVFWIPCGFAQFNERTLSMKKQISSAVWIKINEQFLILINFTHFTMDDSGADCQTTTLALGHHIGGHWDFPPYWRFCGKRRPWVEVSDLNHIVIGVRQYHLRYPLNATIYYTSLDRQMADSIRRKNSYIRRALTHGKPNGISGKSLGVLNTLSHYKWILTVELGYVIQYTSIRTCCFIGSLEIFSGNDAMLSMLRMEKKTVLGEAHNISLVTTYFQSLVILRFHETTLMPNNTEIIALQTMRVHHQTQHLDSNSTTNIKHHGQVLYDIFLFNFTETKFPNVSFVIRQFDGYNEGGCNLGGYAIEQTISNRTLKLLGPYCNGSTSNVPLIDGIQYLVLSKHETRMIFYAYGADYEIDLDLVVVESECEGILDPVRACPFNRLTKRPDRFLTTQIRGYNHNFRCILLNHNLVIIDLIKGCVALQVISIIYAQTHVMEIQGNMLLSLDYLKPHRFYVDAVEYHDEVKLMIGTTENELTTNYHISSEKTTFVRMRFTIRTPYDHDSFAIYLHAIEQTYECANNITERSHVESQSELLLINTNYCGKGVYMKNGLYSYSHRIQKLGDDKDRKHVMYVMIDAKSCLSNNREVLNIFVIKIRNELSHSVDVHGNKTLYVLTPDLTVDILYDKLSSCSIVVLQYRIEEVYEIYMYPISWTIEEIKVSVISHKLI